MMMHLNSTGDHTLAKLSKGLGKALELCSLFEVLILLPEGHSLSVDAKSVLVLWFTSG